MTGALQDGLRDHHLESQLQLLREHWAPVRRLWLVESKRPDIGRFRSSLPDNFTLGCGMPGIARIQPQRSGLFEFSEDGLTAIILPAFDTIPGLVIDNAERQVEELRDLVAVDIDRPDRFWRRRGEALVLGNAYLEIAGQEDEPLPVFRNPLTWLRAEGNGIVVLDWDYVRDLLLDHELIAEDLELGERLEATLKPDIWIMEAAA